MSTLLTLPRELYTPPPQAAVLRRLAEDAARGLLPPEAVLASELGVDELVLYPLPRDGGVVYMLMDRSAASALVEIEREEIRRAPASEKADEWERCRRDRVWFLCKWVSVASKWALLDERGNPRPAVPFVPFPYQVRGVRLYDRARRENRGIFGDKSRQMGESWRYAALFLHALLFEDGIPLFATSRKEAEVDDGGSKGATIKSLFGRVRFMYDHLPEFLRQIPRGRGYRATGAALAFKKLQIRHRASGAFLAGEGATAEIGRGATYAVGLLDEFGRLERSESALASAMAAVRVLIINSTPEGESNAFARLKSVLAAPRAGSDHEVRTRFLVSRLHWSENPIYAKGLQRDADGKLTSPWYRQETAALTPEKAAAEYDISYSGSVPGKFFPEFVSAIHVDEHITLRVGAAFVLVADHGWTDTEVWHLYQTDRRTWAELVDEFHAVEPGQHAAGRRLTSVEVADGVWDWLKGWGLTLWDLDRIIADPSGSNVQQTSGSSHHVLIRAQWARRGVAMGKLQAGAGAAGVPAIGHANNSRHDGIESGRLLLRGTFSGQPFRMRFAARCWLTIDSLNNYRRKPARHGQFTDEEIRDWTNHAADDYRYFAHTMFPAASEELSKAAAPTPYAGTALSTRASRGHR